MANKKAAKNRKSSEPKRSTRAGSHAGRGFRYQDAAAAWLAVRCWAGDLEYGCVTPEGFDDAELSGSEGTAFVQMKSRRDQLGPYLPGDVAPFIRELWERAHQASTSPDLVVLVLERPIRGEEREGGVLASLDAASDLGRLIAKHRLSGAWVSRTRLVVAPSPLEEAIDLLIGSLDCAPILAAVYFAAIADRVGVLSDRNGERAPDSFLTLSVSDIEREIDRLGGVLATQDLESAIRQGLCEPVDFLTELDDPGFYLGADVQPGHLAAGLLTERPEARARVLEALEERRAVLIAGPSGSGKSGLMWEAARSCRHTVRWFRVRTGKETAAVDLLRLGETFRATAHMPVGFVLDDVGRSQSSLWDLLASEASSRPDILLLGSIREEDVFLVTRRSLVAEIRQLPDSNLAERIWAELLERGQTTWPGWREPWTTSNGLLLEYAHLLTEGRRLKDVLREQIDRRLREQRRVELEVLRVTSVAGRARATVGIARLRRTLGIGDHEMSEALKRLVDEHLVQVLAGGTRLANLHQIRASALALILRQAPPPTEETTIQLALQCVEAADLEDFVAGSLSINAELASAVVAGTLGRFREELDIHALAAIFRGLDAGSIADAVDKWLPLVRHSGLPMTQATTVAMFTVAETKPFLTEKLEVHFELAEELRQTPLEDHREVVVTALESDLQGALSASCDVDSLTALLSSLVGSKVPTPFKASLGLLEPDLLEGPLEQVAELLEATTCVAPEAAEAWVSKVGQKELLDRVAREMPWVSPPRLATEPEGVAAIANLLHVSDRLVPEPHERVVDLCRLLFALVPQSALAIASALAPDGEAAGLPGCPLAVKRIPRENLPPKVLTGRNRRWLAAVAQKVAPPGLSRFLAEARKLAESLALPLERLVAGIVRGEARHSHLRDVGAVFEESQALARPPDIDDPGATAIVGMSDLQSAINSCSSELIQGLVDLPERAPASFSQATDTLSRIDRAAAGEPWILIGDGPPAALTRLKTLVEQLLPILGESGERGVRAHQLAPAVVRGGKAGSSLRRLSSWADRQVEARLRKLDHVMIGVLRECGFSGRVASRVRKELLGPWPYCETLVAVDLARIEDWPSGQVALSLPLREAAGDGRPLSLVPVVGGLSIPDQCMAGVKTFLPTPFSNVAWLEELGVPPADLPLTKIWEGLASALLEISSIESLGCAVDGRSPTEREALENAKAELKESRSQLERSWTSDHGEEVLRLVDELMEAGGSPASDFWKGIHAETASEVALALTVAQLWIIDQDLRAHREGVG